MKHLAPLLMLTLLIAGCDVITRYSEDPLQDQVSIQPHEGALRTMPDGVLPTNPHKAGLRATAELEPAQNLEEAKALSNPLSVNRETLATGRIAYDRYCSHCHGDSGHGWTSVGSSLQPSPPDLVETIQGRSDGDIFGTISFGIGEDLHVPIALGGTMSVEDRWSVIHYIRTLDSERQGKAPHWDQAILRDESE